MKVQFQFTILLLIAYLGYGNTSLDVDFSNVDFRNFKYFKNTATSQGSPFAAHSALHPLLENLKPVKLISTYFRHLTLGHPWMKTQFNYAFDPDFGKKYRAAYQRQFGYRGENLVAMIGNGYSRKQLEHYGALGKDYKNF